MQGQGHERGRVGAGERGATGRPRRAPLVGGCVGQYGGQIVTHGIRAAILGRNGDAKWDAAYDALLADTAALEFACAAERQELAALGAQYRVGLTEHVLPALDRLTRTSFADAVPGDDLDYDPDARLADLADTTKLFAGAPLFDTLDAFDEFMADPTSTLVLDLGRK
jgi:hypothetical protein